MGYNKAHTINLSQGATCTGSSLGAWRWCQGLVPEGETDCSFQTDPVPDLRRLRRSCPWNLLAEEWPACHLPGPLPHGCEGDRGHHHHREGQQWGQRALRCLRQEQVRVWDRPGHHQRVQAWGGGKGAEDVTVGFNRSLRSSLCGLGGSTSGSQPGTGHRDETGGEGTGQNPGHGSGWSGHTQVEKQRRGAGRPPGLQNQDWTWTGGFTCWTVSTLNSPWAWPFSSIKWEFLLLGILYENSMKSCIIGSQWEAILSPRKQSAVSKFGVVTTGGVHWRLVDRSQESC